jgi:uncharacterized protein YcfJ
MTQRHPARSTTDLPMEPGDSMVAGPGVVATKSQAKGSMMWALIGAIVGGLFGAIIGAFMGGGGAMVIAIVCFAAAGAIGGGTVGGFVRPKSDTPMEGGSAGIR